MMSRFTFGDFECSTFPWSDFHDGLLLLLLKILKYLNSAACTYDDIEKVFRFVLWDVQVRHGFAWKGRERRDGTWRQIPQYVNITPTLRAIFHLVTDQN